jgi:hypothetical protein
MGVHFDSVMAAQSNLDKLRQCKRHHFGSGFSGPMIGVCDNCKGQMKLADVGFYISGYEAAGFDANEIWPGWRGKKP